MLTYPLLFGSVGFWEIFIVAFIFVLLFGGKKIPELMHGVGKGVKSFKKGMAEVEEELKDVKSEIENADVQDNLSDKK